MFKSLDTANLRRELASEVKIRTAAFADKHSYGKEPITPEKSRKSEKVTKLDELIATGTFGCQSASVAKALSIVLGEEVTYSPARLESAAPRVDPFPMGIALVPLENNSWGSPWGYGVPLINGGHDGNASFFTDAVGKKRQMSGRKANSRPATAKEIDALVAALPDSIVLVIVSTLLSK